MVQTPGKGIERHAYLGIEAEVFHGRRVSGVRPIEQIAEDRATLVCGGLRLSVMDKVEDHRGVRICVATRILERQGSHEPAGLPRVHAHVVARCCLSVTRTKTREDQPHDH